MDKKTEKRWIFAFSITAAVCLIGLFWEHSTVTDSNEFSSTDTIVPADVAWLLTASCLVLLMTPGLSFFMGVW